MISAVSCARVVSCRLVSSGISQLLRFLLSCLGRLVLSLCMVSLVSSLDSIPPRHQHHHHRHRQHHNITKNSSVSSPPLILHPSSHSAPQHGTTVTDRFPVLLAPLPSSLSAFVPSPTPPPLNKPSNPAVVGHLHESGRNEHRLVTRQKRGAGPQ